jgi:hypothetical protein
MEEATTSDSVSDPEQIFVTEGRHTTSSLDHTRAQETIAVAAYAVSLWIEATTQIRIREFIRQLQPLLTVDMDMNGTIITGETPIPDAAQLILRAIENHQVTQT